ncbi:hypothetical protein [Methanobrevibacter sp.]|uniref:hypothetical protein n=1 Tax=Methanobrevibacter sp. TaxID=66852 RepID=UPI0026DF3D3E|nr:hypothetical protein [Methanobrevibacter sp.]
MVSASPNLDEITLIRWVIFSILAVVGIGLSVGSIVYMKRLVRAIPLMHSIMKSYREQLF